MSRWWRNAQHSDQSVAALVAMVAISSVLALVTVATLLDLRTIPDVAAFDAERDDRWGGLIVAVLGWLVLMSILVWVRFARSPDPDRYTRPLPPLPFLVFAAAGLIGASLETEDDMFAGVTIAAGALCWIWVAFLILATEDEGKDERPATQNGEPLNPMKAEPLVQPDPRPVLPPGRHRRAAREPE